MDALDEGSPGTLTANGLYNQMTTGKLLIQIASLNSFGLLNVNGQSDLAGTASFAALNGFTLAAGETFIFLNYNSLFGTFGTDDYSGLNLGPGLTANVIYGYGGGNDIALIINGPTTTLAGVRSARKRGLRLA